MDPWKKRRLRAKDSDGVFGHIHLSAHLLVIVVEKKRLRLRQNKAPDLDACTAVAMPAGRGERKKWPWEAVEMMGNMGPRLWVRTKQ